MACQHASYEIGSGGIDAHSATQAEVIWEGTLEQGNGSSTVGDWVVGEIPTPEELLAASHASCYAMALSLVLDQGGTPPERLEVAATCTLGEVDGAFRITTVDLEVRGRVSGMDAESLQSAAERAHQICPSPTPCAATWISGSTPPCRRALPVHD